MNKQITKQRCLLLLRKNGLFLCGFIFLLALGILYLCTGESIPVTVHDQLDYVIPMSELQSRHLGDGYLPELMGGMPASVAVVGIPGMELFYIAFPPVLAFSSNLVFVMLVAYSSMYACLVMMGVRHWISVLVAFAFACLPFYSVYSLSSMGIPLVVCAVMLIKMEKRIWLSFLLVTLYAFFSSFIWAGFAVCFSLFVVCVVFLAKHNIKKSVQIFCLLLVLLLIYVFANLDVIWNVSTPSFVSHRVEFSLSQAEFNIENVFSLFETGQYHAVSNHNYINVLMIALVLFVGAKWIWGKMRGRDNLSFDMRKLLLFIIGILALLLAIALFAELYSSSFAVSIRMLLPESLRSFQVDRFYWLYPTLWYIGAGLSFELVMMIARKRRLQVLGICLISCVWLLTLGVSIPENNLFKNAKDVIVDHRHDSITWEQFFSEELFQEIKEDLYEKTGTDVSEYRVGSIGMHPFVPLYNGFQTVDGYSVNYPLEYKHRFAKVIQPELDLSDGLNDYFWGWGSRCYLFSHELGTNYLFNKNSNKIIGNLQLDISAFLELGGKYIFSAVPIEKASDAGLKLVDSYSDEKAFYKVWVYEAVLQD